MAITSRRTNVYLKKRALFCRHNVFHKIWKIVQKEKKTVQDCIRFQVKSELYFSENDLDNVTSVEGKYSIKTNITGLVGTQGTLPLYLKEALLKAPKDQQENFHIVYDLLQERSLQLAYEGWARRRMITQVFHPQAATPQFLNSLTGRACLTSPSHTLNANYHHYYAAHFSNPRRSQRALQQMLQEIVAVPVKIVAMQGAWLTLSPEHCTSLGVSKQARLGQNAVCGNRIWSFQTKLRLVVGPIPAERLSTFLPNAESFVVIKNFLLYFMNQPLQWDLQLIIDTVSIIPCALSSTSWNCLGQSSFLKQLPKTGVCSEMTFPLLQSHIPLK